MAGGFHYFQADVAEFDDLAVVKGSKCIGGFGCRAEINIGADAIAEFEMAGDEIGVEMGEKDVLDLEAVFGGESDVLVDVALRIDDGGCGGRFVSDDVGSVSQAR